MDKKIEDRLSELENEVRIMKRELNMKIKINLKIGDTFEVAGIEWKILDINSSGYSCLAIKKMEGTRSFDSDCNNWQQSNLRNELNTTVFKKISNAIGAENIVEFERNLLSMDGQTEYGTCMDKVSLLTADEYRKHRYLIPNTEDYWWWTITPSSTICNDDSRWITVVSPSGNFYDYSYDVNYGVRPFCIFSSSIFESGDK